MSDRCSIIIPAIDINKDVLRCVNGCLAQKKAKISIFLVLNKKVKRKIYTKKINYLFAGDVTMSKKRNLAVKKTKDNYIAFIDSDAFPTKKWISNGIQILKKNNSVGMVTGPDLPFKNQKGWSYIISLAHKSILLSGSKIFRKNIKNEKECDQASSCNMIFKRKAFDKVGGMDEKIYIGEDKDFCDKIKKFYKILYSPKVLIYHKVRDFIPFVYQRFSYGTCVLDILKNNKKFDLNNFQYFIPLMITLFYISLPLSLGYDFLFLTTLAFVIILNFFILIESIRITLNPIKFIKVFLIININIFSFGLGSLMFFLGINSIKKIYTKR